MLVTQAGAGYNGILWDIVGNQWESADFSGFFAANSLPVPGLFCRLNAVDKSV
jgi:hypothetical protein